LRADYTDSPISSNSSKAVPSAASVLHRVSLWFPLHQSQQVASNQHKASIRMYLRSHQQQTQQGGTISIKLPASYPCGSSRKKTAAPLLA